jgi:hypothetical protein
VLVTLPYYSGHQENGTLSISSPFAVETVQGTSGIQNLQEIIDIQLSFELK